VKNERLAKVHFNSVIAMLVILPALHTEPGEVVTHELNKDGILDCGLYPSGINDTVVELAASLETAGYSAQPTSTPMRWKHAKLLSNLVNAAQALIGDVPELGVIAKAMRAEGEAVLRAKAIDFATQQEEKDRNQGHFAMGDIKGYPRLGGSTWQSMTRGTGNVETEWLNGEIVRLGREAGVATPINTGLVSLMNEALEVRMPAGSYGTAALLAKLGL